MNETFETVLSGIGAIAVLALVLIFIAWVNEQNRLFWLKFHRLIEDRNDHSDKLRDYQKRIEWLELLERERAEVVSEINRHEI